MDGIVVGFLDVVVHPAAVGRDGGTAKNVVYLEVEELLVVGGAQAGAGFGKGILQSLRDGAMGKRGGGVVEVATHNHLPVLALLYESGNGLGLFATDLGGCSQLVEQGFGVALQLVAFGQFQHLFVQLAVFLAQAVRLQVAVYQQHGVVIYLQLVGYGSVVAAGEFDAFGRKDGVFGVAGKGARKGLLAFAYLDDAVVFILLQCLVHFALGDVMLGEPHGILLQADDVGIAGFQVFQYPLASLFAVKPVEGHDVVRKQLVAVQRGFVGKEVDGQSVANLAEAEDEGDGGEPEQFVLPHDEDEQVAADVYHQHDGEGEADARKDGVHGWIDAVGIGCGQHQQGKEGIDDCQNDCNGSYQDFHLLR